MRYIPKALILFRLILAPCMIMFALSGAHSDRSIIVALLYVGLLSDIFDGIIARNVGVQNAALRRMDSQVDMIFWLSAGISTWLLQPDLISSNRFTISIIFLMEIACYVISIIKFAKETCTHALLSKMWGLSLLAAFTALIGFNHAGIPFSVAIILGFISHIDRILITLILPQWTHDIPSAYHAYLISKGRSFKRNKLFN